MSNNRGFTLLELLIVMVISAALLAIVPPMLSRQLEQADFKRSARELASALRSARTAAVASQREQSVQLDLVARRYRDHRGGEHHLPAEPTIKLHTARSEIAGARIGSIRFYPDGSATGGGLSLSDGQRQLRVEVDWLTGRTQLHEDTGS